MLNARLMSGVTVIFAAALALLCMTATSHAEYPERPVTVVVPFAAGGGGDTGARYVLKFLSERMKASFLVENRPGANGIVGSTAVARSAPDGYTILSNGGSTFSPEFVKKESLTIDVFRDLTPISAMYRGFFAVMVNAGLPVRNFKEFIAYAKANPGKLNYGATSPQGMMVAELIKAQGGVGMVQIPYKGDGPGSTALLSGEVQMVTSTLTAYLPHIRSGKVRLIAITDGARSSLFPDVPTLVEEGYRDFVATFVTGMWAPAGTPQAAVAKLNRDMGAVLEMPEVKNYFRDINGSVAEGSTPEKFRDAMRQETDFWSRAARSAKYEPQ